MTKRSWERVVFGVRDADVVVWGADPGGKGWEGGFLSVFWAGGGEGSGGVLFLGQSGGPPLWVSPLGVYLRDSGFVPLRGLDFGHFVHGTFTQAIMDTYFPTVELDVHEHG